MECHSLLELMGKYSLILHEISPYLTTASLLNLAATNKAYHELVFRSKETFRYLDLSTTKGANVNIPPIDVGGFNWRNERIDESTTAEDFYSGPIRGIFSFLRRKNVLTSIQVLILDDVSAPAEVLREIICDEPYQVRILSVIGSKNLNEKKFQQVLRYAVRPSRQPGTPKLQGVYCFGINPRPSLENLITPISIGVTNSPGAQLGAALNRKSHSALQSSGLAANVNPWYQNSGKVLPRVSELSDWAATLKACENIIYFDAILCRGPRHDPSSPMVQASPQEFIGSAIAGVALRGCEVCCTLPEGPANSKDSPSTTVPLLSPIPWHSSTVKAAQTPIGDPESVEQGQFLYARCMQCCLDRWCEGCGKFWCEDHYDPARSTFTHMQRVEMLEAADGATTSALPTAGVNSAGRTSYLKVHLGLCIEQCLVNELMAGSGADGMWG